MAPRKNVTSPGLFGPDEAVSLPDPESSPKPSRKKKPQAAPPPVDDRLAASLSRLPALVERLEAMIAEIPKAAEFEPLAEHIYSFAQIGPRLLESLESVKDSVPQIDSATRALEETAATLQDTNQRLAESLMQFPTAEDYEPLAAPLVEFARISPALTETLRDAVISFGAVSQVARRLEGVSKSLRPEEKPDPVAAKASEKTEGTGATQSRAQSPSRSRLWPTRSMGRSRRSPRIPSTLGWPNSFENWPRCPRP